MPSVEDTQKKKKALTCGKKVILYDFTHSVVVFKTIMLRLKHFRCNFITHTQSESKITSQDKGFRMCTAGNRCSNRFRSPFSKRKPARFYDFLLFSYENSKHCEWVFITLLEETWALFCAFYCVWKYFTIVTPDIYNFRYIVQLVTNI